MVTAMLYMVAAGHNNPDGLVVITPQPHCPGAHYARRVYAVNGMVYDDGALLSTFRYSAVSAEEYAALLALFGLTAATSALVTVRTTGPGPSRVFANYNATIVRPADPPYRNGVYHDADFELVGMEPL